MLTDEAQRRDEIGSLVADCEKLTEARQRLGRRLNKLASYAVHQPTCTAVLCVTNHCSCGLHAVLKEVSDGD